MKRIGAVLALGLVMVGTLYAADEKLHTRERYRLHTGDSLLLEYRLSPELNQTAMIAPDGYVDLNVAGSINLAGLTLQQPHNLIVQRPSDPLNQPKLKLQL